MIIYEKKETVNGIGHRRPCFFAFPDEHNPIYWLIPVSSRYEKYKGIYDKKVAKYGFCNTLCFGNVAGIQAVFLIQNMCPATNNYIVDFYVDKASKKYVAVDKRIEEELVKNAKSVLAKQRKGIPLIFPDVLKIEKALIQQLDAEKNTPIVNPSNSQPKPEKEHTPFNDLLVQLTRAEQSKENFIPKAKDNDPIAKSDKMSCIKNSLLVLTYLRAVSKIIIQSR
jgi:hypothetical protein